jgi:hypothetical protein
MMMRQKLARLTTGVAAAALLVAPALAEAQSWDYINPIPAGTTVQVRTTESIDAQTADGRIFKGTVESDVRDAEGRLAIPSGALAELVVRRDTENDLVLDLDSVTVNGRRYGVDATRNRIGGGIDVRNSGIGANKETARNVGGGALLGAILGADSDKRAAGECSGRVTALIPPTERDESRYQRHRIRSRRAAFPQVRSELAQQGTRDLGLEDSGALEFSFPIPHPVASVKPVPAARTPRPARPCRASAASATSPS